MTKRMLIDGSHPEEIRVVITDGNRLDEYDIETSTKTQLKGNIYLAKVTRVEPSLQAAFVDYGGGRHGFLAFSEIHPDYYQIPIEDREALKQDLAQLEGKAQAAQAHVDEIDGEVQETDEHYADDSEDAVVSEEVSGDNTGSDENLAGEADAYAAGEADAYAAGEADENPLGEADTNVADTDAPSEAIDAAAENQPGDQVSEESGAVPESSDAEAAGDGAPPEKSTERRGNPMRRYKIQEVIKRRQILLVQVVKEERGNKGAAITTYLSLAGRYCVLMPNATRSGGGVSRKITSAADRRRLRDLLKDLNVPEGMGVIMRTAGMERNKSEIKRDFDYLMRLWEDVRALTLESAAPALVYEEGDLIKRAIRDLYARDIEEVAVEGTEAYQAAKKLMRLMMPSHAKRVQPYRDPIPLFHRYQVETQLESMHNPVVQLKSGGYIVIDTTEALVAIDVNSGRSTKERNIEETAVKTNLEAAAEIGRQLRLRDLAGLIVIDFIDMDDHRNERAVERRLKEAIKVDRARIQIGRISGFGLLEMSRQRLRPSLAEALSQTCPLCSGTGHVRTTESTTLHVLRGIENEGLKTRASAIRVMVPTDIALYLLNQKRQALLEVEQRYNFTAVVERNDDLIAPDFRIEVITAREADGDAVAVPAEPAQQQEPRENREPREQREPREYREPERKEVSERDRSGSEEEGEDGEPKKRRRRRRRKGRGEGGETRPEDEAAPQGETGNDAEDEDEDEKQNAAPAEASSNEDDDGSGRKRRRRGRRGGRRRRGRSEDGTEDEGGNRNEERAAEPAPRESEEAAPRHAPVPSRQAVWTDDDGVPDTTPREDDPRPTARRRKDPLTEIEDDLELDLAQDPAAAVRREPPVVRKEEPAAQEAPGEAAPEPVASAPAEPEPAAKPEPAAAEPEPVAEPEPEQPAGPPRRGWWNKIVGS